MACAGVPAEQNVAGGAADERADAVAGEGEVLARRVDDVDVGVVLVCDVEGADDVGGPEARQREALVDDEVDMAPLLPRRRPAVVTTRPADDGVTSRRGRGRGP